MSIKVTNDNYTTYKKIFEIISQRLYKDLDGELSPETDPVNVLNRWETKNKSIAKRGLQVTLNDCLSNISHYQKEMLTDIDAELNRNMLPDLFTLSGFIQKTLKRVIKTGVIKNIDQYYIVKDVLDDIASEISADERENLSESIRNYESTTKRDRDK